MNAVVGLAFLSVTAVTLSNAASFPPVETGGWTEADPWGDTKYLKLAKYAASREKSGLRRNYAALWLNSVSTQVVAGMNYKIELLIARRHCQRSGIICRPANYYVRETCTAIIHEPLHQNIKKVLAFDCVTPK
ncbi:cystatin-2-like [Amblyomma americanum]